MDKKSYQDYFFKKAKLKGFRSRSAFKLIELNSKFKFLRNGLSVLDVGSFPGGWCQVIQKKIINSKILAIDLKNIEKIDEVHFIKGDFLNIESKIAIKKYFNSRMI